MQVFSLDEKVRVTCPKTFKGCWSGPWRALVGACRGTSLNCRKAGSVRAVTSAPVQLEGHHLVVDFDCGLPRCMASTPNGTEVGNVKVADWLG